jgi:threonylcarbamoyladenosine tRNA methylthiotransferase MtaB
MVNLITFESFSFGCRVNEAERLVMNRQMIEAGFLYNERTPDLCIINSCAVTTKAEREARQHILKLKRVNPDLKIVITGCSATYWEKNGLWKNIPIDLLISNKNKAFLVARIKQHFSARPEPIQLDQLNEAVSDKFLSSGRVMIKIQDGCHRFCSYCIVPYLRGEPRSKKIGQILAEIDYHNHNYRSARMLQEVIFTAINTESFGHDTGESLIDLIDLSINRTRVPRISFGSIHPWSIDEGFIEYYRKISKNQRFSSFFHVPIQSGSNKTLRLMKRNYTRDDVHERLNQIRKINPLALIGTDVIVGYLDETDRDFQDTYSFLEKSPIDKFHVFRFSVRKNTAAAHQRKRLREPTAQEKIRRAKSLIDLGLKKYQKFLLKHVGVTGQALFIGELREGYQTAILNNQVQVLIPRPSTLNGQMRKVRITKLISGVLYGNLITP